MWRLRDAWVKFYRGNENSKNTTISYYTKGAVVAWLLDARIRKATGNAKTLDDVMRLAYARHSGEAGYTSAEFRAIASEVAHEDLTAFFDSAVDSTDELDYSPALDQFGFTIAALSGDSDTASEDDAGDEETDDDDDSSGEAFLGLITQGGQISMPKRGTPAWEAGFNDGDELLAINGFRVTDFPARLKRYQPGDAVDVLISRRGKLRTITVTLTEKDSANWDLVVDDDRPEAVARRDGWWDAPE